MIELRLKYSDLLLKSINSPSLRKGYNTYLKGRRKNGNQIMKGKQRKNKHKINILKETNRLMTEELRRREHTIMALQVESDKLLRSIYSYENDLKNNEITLEKVSFLETQLIKLQHIIEYKINNRKTDEINVNTSENLQKTSEEDLAATPKAIKNVAKNTKCINRLTNTPKRIINMYSDNFGKNMASKIIKYLPDTYKVINNCKPENDFADITKESLAGTSNDEPIIWMIGNYRSLKGNSAEYISNIEKVAKEKTRRKIIVATIAYEQKLYFRNNEIMKINSKLYTLASLLSNVNVIELNKEQRKKLLPTNNQDESAKYIATACLHGVNRSNLKVLGEDLTLQEMNTASQNFPHQEPLRAVR